VPALAVLRGLSGVKVKMLDQTPGEMIIALRRGEIDIALTLHGIDCSRAISMPVKLRLSGVLLRFLSATGWRPKKGVFSQLKGETFVRDRTMSCRIHPEDHSVLPEVWRLPSAPGHR